MKNKFYKLIFILFALPFISNGQVTVQNLPFTPNGTVHCQKQVGNTLYLGGDFTSVDVNTGSLAGLSLSSTPTQLQLPFVNGTVNTIVSDGAGGYLIGGSFSSVGGQYRLNFARITAAMTVHPMDIRFNGTIEKILVHNGIAYAFGGFSSIFINNVSNSRPYAAAINLSNGSITNWSSNVSSGYIFDAAINGTILYIGGFFNINNERRVLASYDLNSGGILNSSFRPIISWNGSTSNAYVYSLTIANNRLYFGGYFNKINNISCSNVSSINLLTNTPNLLTITLNNYVTSLAWNNNILYVGGYFTTVNNTSRPRLFAYNTTVNSVFSSWSASPDNYIKKLGVINNNLWVSGGFTSISSNTRSYFASYILNSNINVPPVLNTTLNPNPNSLVMSILPVGNTTWLAGGYFNKISTAGIRRGVVAINLLDNSITSFAPNVEGSVRAIEVVGSNVFLGGGIWRVNGSNVTNFVVVNANSGQLNNSYKASFNGYVFSILASGSQLYVGGNYTNLTVFAGNTATNRNQNCLASLGLGSNNLTLNTSFNGNISGGSQYVKTIKMFNGQLFVGGNFTSPRTALASLNPSNGALLPFNANIQSSWYNGSCVNDMTLTPQNSLAICGTIQYINNYYTYNLAYVNPSSGAFIRSNYGSNYVSGMQNPIEGLVSGNSNDVMYINSGGLWRTDNNTGSTASAYSIGGSFYSLSKIGTRYIMGGNFGYYNSGTYSYNLLALDFIPPMPPTVPASNITFSNITTNSMQVNWTNGNGNSRILMVRELNMGLGHPSNATTYYQNNYYGYGSNIGGAFVMYNGTGNSAYLYNLQPGTKYEVKVVEYNGTGGTSMYSSNFASGSQFTSPILPPTIGSASVSANSITKNSMGLNFSSGNGNGRLVIAREGAPVNVTPSADVNYSASSTFGYGSHLGSGNYVIARNSSNYTPMYNLKPGTTYYFSVYEYNNYGSFIWRYNTTQVASNNATTFAIAPEPTVAASAIQVTNNGGGSVKVRWTNGSGSRRILLATTGGFNGNGIYSVNTTDGIGYTPNATLNSNTPYPSFVSVNYYGYWYSNRVVYNGTLDSTIVYGLNSNTTYNFIVVEYNTLGPSTENYQQNAWATTFFSTPPLVVPPTIPANNVKAIASSNNQMRLTWNNGNGSRRIVVGKKGSPVNFTPQFNANYSASSNFGNGSNLNNGNFVLYNGSDNNTLVNNLEANTDYYFSVFEYNFDYNYYTYQNEIRYLSTSAQATGKTKPENWPRVAGGSGTDAAGGVSTDASGNVFTAGTFKGTSNNYFGVTQVFGAGAEAFLSKHNSQGVLQWVKTAGGSGDDAASMVTVDNSGNAIIVGSFRSTATFSETQQVTSLGTDDAFIAKYNTNGVLQWVRTMGGTGQDVAYWAKTDANGDIVVTGYFQATLNFSNSTQTLTSAGNSDIWIAKYSGSNGNLLWAVSAGGNSYDYGHSITIGQNNSVIVAGEFKTTASFGSSQLSTNTSESRAFVAKLNSSGAWQWAIGIGSKSKALGITADVNDNYYAVGGFADTTTINGVPFNAVGLSDAFISRINSNGNIQWINKMGGVSEDGASGVSIASDGLIYTTGTFASTCSFNTTTTLTAAGGQDIYTAAFTNNGLLASARRFGGSLEDRSRAIHAADASNIYLCGVFTGTADFGGFVLDATPGTNPNLKEWDLFVHNIASTYTPPSASNDLIAWYKFNNSLNDFSGNNFNATFNGSPVYVNDRLNTANSSLSFNGTTGRTSSLITKPEYDNLNEFTYTAWVKMNTLNNINYYTVLLDKTSSNGNHHMYVYTGNDGSIYFYALDAGQNTGGYFYSNPGAIIANAWTHIAVTFKAGNSTKLFVNGTELSASNVAAYNTLLSFNNRELTLGAFKNNSSSYSYLFNGSMDDVRLYKRALTQQEINDIRNSSSANSMPPIETKAPSLISDEPSLLYPNPNFGSFNLNFNYSNEKSLSFRMVDISGKVIFVEDAAIFSEGQHDKKFELTGLNKGYYILQVLENNRVFENHQVIINE